MWYKAVVARAVNDTIDRRLRTIAALSAWTSATWPPRAGHSRRLTLPSQSSAIIEVREKVGVTRQICNVMPTSGDTLTVPRKLGGLTVYIVPETTAITASDKTWSSISLRASIAQVPELPVARVGAG